MLSRRKSGVSLAMIVRDEEMVLPGCLTSASALFDEVIVVDTGSVDRTRDVAKSYGATVVDFPWCDDFSAARNMALTRCTCDYTFWLDADEVLTRASRTRLARLFKRGIDLNTVYVMCQISNRPDGAFGFTEALSPRLFPNRREICWSRRVYEELPPALSHGLRSTFINIHVHHLGFARPASLLSKLLRNRRLLEMELTDHADDPLALFNLALTHALIGRCAYDLNDINQSRLYLEKLLEKHNGVLQRSLEVRTFALLALTYRALGNISRSLEICERLRPSGPPDVGLVDVEAILLRDLGMWEKAEALYARLPKIQEYENLRNLGNERYLAIVSAKVAAAYYYEEMGKHCEAFLIWAELVRNSAGMFDAAPGLRRMARRVLRGAVLNPRRFLDEVRRQREGIPSGSNVSASPVGCFSRRGRV